MDRRSADVQALGKTDLERGVAEADADAAWHRSHAVEIDLVARVKTAFAQYNAAQRAVELSKSLKQRVDQLLELLRLRYGASSVQQEEVIKAELEAATAAADVARREGEAKSAAARLNALIGRDARAAWRAQGFSRTQNKTDACRRSGPRTRIQPAACRHPCSSAIRDDGQAAHRSELLSRHHRWRELRATPDRR